MSLRTLPTTRHSLFLLKSLKYLCSSSSTLSRRSQAQTLMSFFLLTRSPLYKHPNMYVDHMHQPWRTLASIINKCLSGKTASNDRRRKSRIDILWGMFYRENVDYPELIWEDFAFQIDHIQLKKGRRENMSYPRIGEDYQEYGLLIPEMMLTDGIKQLESYYMFIKYSTVVIPSRIAEAKAYKGRSLQILLKKLLMYLKNQTLNLLENELLAEECLTEAAEEEAVRQVHATHARIVTESVLEPARRRPSGIAFRDTSGVSKKMSPYPSQKLQVIHFFSLFFWLVVLGFARLLGTYCDSVDQTIDSG
ncbi:hypothetical protein Tco_1379543 [Tanacetum coccineum]